MTKINLITEIKSPIQVVFDCARSIDIHELSTAKTNEKAIGGKISGLCELNDEVTWRAKHFRIYQKLTAKITAFDAPFYFQDSMVKGAFKYFKHDHYFEERNGLTLMRDVFEYGVPYSIFGELFDILILKTYMTNFLEERNQFIKSTAEVT